MAVADLRTFAGVLASYARTHLASVHRAAMLVRLNNQESLVATVFGNDNYAGDRNARREVEFLRRQLLDRDIEELAFGLSEDGYTWALLVRADNQDMQTAAGKGFRLEMLKAYLDDAVWAAWRTASATGSDDSDAGALHAR